MSELTPCNHCTLSAIRRRAKAAGQKVTVLSDASWGMGGKNVYVHPPDVNPRTLSGGEDGGRKQYRVAWFAELGGRCSC